MSSLKPVGSRQTAVVRRLDLGEGIQLQVLRFKSSQGNFRINIPKFEARASCAMIPRDIIEQKAYLIWERKGRPTNPPQDTEVLLKNVSSESHIILAVNLKGYTVLHWGVSRTSAGEWLVPPPEILPERSKMLNGACQTTFKEISDGQKQFQAR
ncbi:hypothetical protein GW17_00047794 [Ensete ventricosum]|nr:hypothetical protein GW17_00047794 [Ensete ventricosum]